MYPLPFNIYKFSPFSGIAELSNFSTEKLADTLL